MIRRYFYPTYFFKDPRFFTFDSENFKEDNCIELISDLSKGNISKEIKKEEYNNCIPIIFQQNDFILLRPIYSNSTAYYYLVIHKKSFHIFSMKTLYDSNNVSNLEINFCKQSLNHRCFVRCYGFIMKNNKVSAFIYEYMSNGSLKQFLAKNQIDYFFSMTTLCRVLSGINFLHSHSRIHRDLKPSNILIDHNYNAFISDYETIKEINESDIINMTLNFGTLLYASPEQIQGLNYNNGKSLAISYSTDIYSFGLIIYYIFEKKNLYSFTEIETIINFIKKKKIPQIKNIPIEIQNLFERCIRYNIEERPTINEIIKIIYEQTLSFYFFDHYFLIDGNTGFLKEELCQYFVEITRIICKFLNSDELQAKIDSLSNLFKSILNNNLSEILYDLGHLYCLNSFVKQNYKEAIKYYRLSIKYNNSNAMISLGNLYFHGIECEQNYRKAKEYYEKAEQLGNAKSFYFLGLLYLYGFGVEKDFNMAEKYFIKAVKNNNSEAMYNLGIIYYQEQGVKQDLVKAKKYLEMAANNNHINAIYTLGFFYYYGIGVDINYIKARELLELAAKEGDSNSQCLLGFIYDQGLGVKQNHEKAMKYFEFSAKQNNPNALYYLGNYYLNGKGIEVNYEKAKYYFELAAKQNDSSAINILGVMYYKGQGVKIQYDKAKEYFEKSAKLNNQVALNNLGKIYYYGYGVPKDYRLALTNFKLAAKQNSSDALNNLGLYYYEPPEIKQNYAKAIKYFKLAANQKYSLAYAYLGLICENGYGIEKNYIQAKKYYEYGSFLQNPDCIFHLGKLYLNGNGIPKNYIKAIEYFLISSERNNLNSYYFLGYIYENGKGTAKDLSKAIEYYSKCSQKKERKYLYDFQDGIEERISYNEYFYEAKNNIGLIYIIHKKIMDMELAEEYIKDSALSEYPFAQNNYGLFCQFFQNNTGNAIYMYERALKNHFCLAAFNLGHYYELCGEKDESFQHFKQFLKYENEPLIFKNINIKDEQLEICKIFINSYVNLKLIQNIFSTNNFLQNIAKIKNKLLNAIFCLSLKLLLQSDEYSFSFTFIHLENHELNLEDFILGCPIFLLTPVSNSLWKKWINAKKKRIIISNDQYKSIYTQKLKINLQNDIESNEIENNGSNQIGSIIDKIIHKMNLQNKINVINKEDKNYIHYEIKFIENDGFERTLIYQKDLLKSLFSGDNIYTLRTNINNVIEKMNKILFSPPYSILFGRIKHYTQFPQKNIPNINEDFYKGLDMTI